jgi:hypothetical protein
MSVIEFPNATSRPRAYRRRALPRARVRNGPDLRCLLFRSSRLIVEADETELVEHVGLALDRASSKLERVKQRLKDVQEEAAAESDCSRRPKPS